ncbi:hypothetical protein TIFTF001_030764 [Ficus carica]|uniref:Uncharacterized protein n=1 Tax=Ficus carica TaxID=3494 RepID=A0AA88J4L4_FICCA|nr:hypothetical protein TIFTF001_030764 [Ficus carica]
MATLIFCTASSSYKPYSVKMRLLNLLIVDEAQQMKECEFSIPLQLPGLQQAILFGGHCQLPASVTTKVSLCRSWFRKKFFKRLSLKGHPIHFLNIQYRMHPFITFFLCSKFYTEPISDAPIVRNNNYSKSNLPGPLFGPYSFINISCGNEEMDDVQYGKKNMVEVAVVTKIVQNLYRAWKDQRKKEWNENAVFDFESGWQPQFIGALEFVACVVSELLCNEQDAKTWIGKSKFSSECHQLLDRHYFSITTGFYESIRNLKPGNVDENVDVLFFAFRNIGNPLVLVSSGRSSAYKTSDAIFVDLEAHRGR